jgi:hemerythrin superfamily protein
VASIVDSVTGVLGGSSGESAVDLLKADHDKVDKLFQTVKANEDGDNSDVFLKIKYELQAHAYIEEMVFYPHCLDNGDEELKKIVREGIEEHRQVKMVLAEMTAESGRDPEFKAKMMVLIEDVEHHVQEEEGEMFPLVEDQFDDETLNRLGMKMQAEKQRFIEGETSRAASAQ